MSRQSELRSGMELIISIRTVIKLVANAEPATIQILVSNHDEADTRLILHAADALHTHDFVVIRSVDTDVLVIAIHDFPAMVQHGVMKDVVMHLGTGAYKRYLSLIEITENMPTSVIRNILLMHALTGCDSTSSLFRVTKRQALEILMKNDIDMSALGDKDCIPPCTETEKFIALLYGDYETVTEARYQLLAKKT